MSYTSNNLIQRSYQNNFGDITSLVTGLLQSNGVRMDEFIPIPFDIIDDDNNLKIYAYIPGVDLTTLSVDFYNNILEIKGERKCPFNNTSIKYREEIIYGNFKKQIELPICVTRTDSVLESRTDNGVLEIIIDKLKEESNFNKDSVNVFKLF